MNLSPSLLNTIGTVQFANSADIDNFFVKTYGEDFISWFSAHIAGRGSWVRPGTTEPVSIATDTNTRNRFNQLWSNDSIQTIFGTGQVTFLQFVALQSIILNEAGAYLLPATEMVGYPGHPGIAYAFDYIPELKQSYNTLAGNRTCFQLFNDANYNGAFGSQPLAAQLKYTTDAATWAGQQFPPNGIATSTHPELTGYLLEADFFKFRGRGFIQTTGRSNYTRLIEYILQYTGTNATIAGIKAQWIALATDADTLATVSTNLQWDTLFQDTDCLVAGRAIAIHNTSFHTPYLQALNTTSDIALVNSINNMGRCISGSREYAALFENRVLEVLEKV